MAKTKTGDKTGPWKAKNEPYPQRRPTGEHLFGIGIRLAYIESRMFLDGDLNSAEIMSVLEVSRPTYSRDLHIYLATHGQAVNYDSKKKRWVLDRRFTPKILKPEHLASFPRYVESIKSMSANAL